MLSVADLDTVAHSPWRGELLRRSMAFCASAGRLCEAAAVAKALDPGSDAWLETPVLLT